MNISKEALLTASLSVSENNQIEVHGVLNFDTVPDLMRQAEILMSRLIDGSNDVRVSFKGVTDSNSAGLAMLLEMKRYMHKKNKNIVFSDLPEQVRIVAHACGIDAELSSYLGLQDFALV